QPNLARVLVVGRGGSLRGLPLSASRLCQRHGGSNQTNGRESDESRNRTTVSGSDYSKHIEWFERNERHSEKLCHPLSAELKRLSYVGLRPTPRLGLSRGPLRPAPLSRGRAVP